MKKNKATIAIQDGVAKPIIAEEDPHTSERFMEAHAALPLTELEEAKLNHHKKQKEFLDNKAPVSIMDYKSLRNLPVGIVPTLPLIIPDLKSVTSELSQLVDTLTGRLKTVLNDWDNTEGELPPPEPLRSPAAAEITKDMIDIYNKSEMILYTLKRWEKKLAL